MLRNYFKITFRNFRRHKGYAAINIIGLAFGIACCALLMLFVRDELTFDRFHEKADQIYRVHRATYDPSGGVGSYDVYLPFPLGPAMQADFPDVERHVRFMESSHFVRRDREAVEEDVLYADPAVFEMFSFPLLIGHPGSVLEDADHVVLSRAYAQKYFGTDNPVGRTLSIRLSDTYETFIVSGVAEDVPGNSSIRFDILLSFEKLPQAFDWIRQRQDRWDASAFITYVELSPGSTLADDPDRLVAFRSTYYPGERENWIEEGRWAGDGIPVRYGLQSIRDVHLQTEIGGGLTPASNPLYSYILFGISLAILLIACINFMTLSLGRSSTRAREVGIRKVVGAGRMELAGQFWGEALCMSFLALVSGIAIAELLLPTFNTLSGKSLRFDYLQNWETGVMLVVLMIVTGLLAGSYPAMVLSRFQPVQTLKQTLKFGGANRFSKSLVIFQFGLSVFLLISTFIMFDQLRYLQSKSLGFDAEQVVIIQTNDVDGDRAVTYFLNELANEPNIVDITGTSSSIGQGRGWSRIGFDYGDELKQVYEYRVHANYPDLLGMELTTGRLFDPRLASDSTRSILVNEALVRDFGWSDPIGQELTGLSPDGIDPVVIGVVKDYHFQSLHEAVQPVMLTLNRNSGRIRSLMVKIEAGQVSESIARLRSTWQQLAPDVPFEYSFLDDDINRFYQAEEQWSRIVGYATLFALFIACLGLLGLAALSAAGRIKEIGIRKVLGASVPGVVALLSRDFAKLVLFGILLAVPAAYWVMDRWLSGFAFRIDLSWTVFLWAGLAAVVVAVLTVSYQAIRAALADPVDALRYE